jgi:hypothetical protein
MAHSLIKIARETWFFWALFLCVGFAFGRFYTTGHVAWQFRFAFSFVFAILVAAWVMADAKRRQRTLSFGFPALVFFIWPIFAPVYLFQTRGVRAFLSLLGFAIAYYISTVAGAFIGRMTI